MAKMGRAKQRKEFRWLGGGLVTRYDDKQLNVLQQGKLWSPYLLNVDFFKLGSIRSRNEFSQAGEALNSNTGSMTGLWDIRFTDTGALTQFYGAACDGKLFAGDPNTVDGGGTWDGAIYTGGNSNYLQLWDSVALQNYYFFTDYAANANRVWDGVDGADRTAPYGPTTRANSTGKHGYRATATIAQSAAGAGNWTTTGLVQVLFVTQLISGGYRATTKEITLSGTGNQIDLTSVAIDSTYDQFYFDIDALATTIYCTKPGDSIFYKVPVAYMSTGTNPIANTTTSFSILPMTDAQLQAGGDIENALALPTGYFTSQVDTPQAKFLEVFADSLCMAGDDNYPSSVWISAQLAPQVWSEYGKIYGTRIDVAPNDGEILTGIHVADGALFAAKQHNLYRIDFTGDSNEPWRVRLVHGGLGTLSHWSMEVIPKGLFFLSERGPSICYGTYSNLTPTAVNILNLFSKRPSDFAYVDGYINQAMLPYTSVVNDTSKNRLYIAIGTNDAVSYKTGALIYDYSVEEFSYYSSMNCNVLSSIGDASGIPNIWYGAAAVVGGIGDKVYYLNPDTYNISGVIFTPFLDFGSPSEWKDGAWIWLFGKTVTPVTFARMDVALFVNGSSSSIQTTSIDISQANYSRGIGIPIAPNFQSLRVQINWASDGTVPFELNYMAIEYTTEGERQ